MLGIYCTSHYIYTKIQAKFLSNQDERAPLVTSEAIRVPLGHFASYWYSCTTRVSTIVLWPVPPRSWVLRAAARNGQNLVLNNYRILGRLWSWGLVREKTISFEPYCQAVDYRDLGSYAYSWPTQIRSCTVNWYFTFRRLRSCLLYVPRSSTVQLYYTYPHTDIFRTMRAFYSWIHAYINLCEFVYSVSSVFVEGPLYKKNMLSETFFLQSPLYTFGRCTRFKRPPIVLG